MGEIIGHKLTVQVLTPEQKELERKAKVLEGKQVERVTLSGDQLVIEVTGGVTLSFLCSGGFREIS